MSDGFSSPSYEPPHNRPPEHRQARHAYQNPHNPSPPEHPGAGPPYASDTAPTYATYPWAEQQPEPVPWRAPRRSARGRHNEPHHDELRDLRGAYRLQRRVATFTALGYFTLFLVLSAFAPSFMTGTVSGGLSTGLLLGLLQVPVTCLAIWLYERTARRRVDPLAESIRTHSEFDARREAAR
ncbi:DUF485 domain-containing protein [Streptomyces spongiae]|uniref:DUF485 domain-containing protein n=1 Tax=Streptomyces spongiae TaxID=565072 RepID=A0A5N8XXK0_9ACTN|nr:DUF485 domain-containing protein [Streptomyces spongiae]MPY64097.1 DUF485 domain-containing protein [Streptomyces spongiae]